MSEVDRMMLINDNKAGEYSVWRKWRGGDIGDSISKPTSSHVLLHDVAKSYKRARHDTCVLFAVAPIVWTSVLAGCISYV